MRTVEIYTGAYASGKSENAINRAISYIKENKEITLVDLDTVEPAYCMRPLEKTLKDIGINLILQSDYFGLGEAGSYVTNEQINCLKKTTGDIIIDVGYGVTGLDTLDIINDIDLEKNINIFLVVNTAKFETKDVESILEYIEFNNGENQKPWKKITGFVSNTHLGDETTKEDIIRGYKILKEVSNKTSIPIVAISVDEKFKGEFEADKYDNKPVRYLTRLMPKALW
ncbi:MAG: hypothetical protein IJB79_04635 [Candidatus Gastranaerophilales bacterium]|nr:hypothetical protein [Candidatus Gastranaerophilales bacterium]